MEKLAFIQWDMYSVSKKINELVEEYNKLQSHITEIQRWLPEEELVKLTSKLMIGEDKYRLEIERLTKENDSLAKERDHFKELYIDQLRLNNFNNTHE